MIVAAAPAPNRRMVASHPDRDLLSRATLSRELPALGSGRGDAMGGQFDIILTDDQVVFLEALTSVLRQLGHRVIAADTSYRSARESVTALQPDLWVLESHFDDAPDLAAMNDLALVRPETKIVVLTADGDAQTVRRALDLGASAYVHKTRGVAVLVRVMQQVMAGAERVVERALAPALPPPADAKTAELLRLANYLTQRELQCLRLLAAGRDTRSIARQLGVSSTTVRTHVQAVLTKLGAHSRLEAASLAVRHGLVADAEPGIGVG